MKRIYEPESQNASQSNNKAAAQEMVSSAVAVQLVQSPEHDPVTSSSKVSKGENLAHDQDWGPAEHRHFVAAVFELGMQHASPNVVSEKMTMNEESVNAERLKSKLQKYRKRKDQSKEAFLEEYDWWLRAATGARDQGFVIPSVIASSPEADHPASNLRGGHRAAFLSYCSMYFLGDMSNPNPIKKAAGTMKDPDQARTKGVARPRDTTKNLSPSQLQCSGQPFQMIGGSQFARIPWPNLSKEEAQTPLGLSIVEMMRLLDSYSRHIMMQRAKKSVSKSPGNGQPRVISKGSTSKRSVSRQPSMGDNSKGSSDDGDSKLAGSHTENMSLSSWGSDDRNQMQQALASGEAEDLDMLFHDTT